MAPTVIRSDRRQDRRANQLAADDGPSRDAYNRRMVGAVVLKSPTFSLDQRVTEASRALSDSFAGAERKPRSFILRSISILTLDAAVSIDRYRS